jgi:hypothetical protein
MKLHCLTRTSGVLAALLLASVAFPASAHHSAAPFDMTKQQTLDGTVEKWVWANPHSWLYMQVIKSDGSQEVWGLEAGSTGMLARSGWGAFDMKPGDKVTVTYSPEREGKHIGLLMQVKLPNGRMLIGGGVPPPDGPGAYPAPGAAPVAPATR